MAGVKSKILLLEVVFVVFVQCQDVVYVPPSDLVYELQRSSTLPMTLECPSPKYKFIEVKGVTLANDTHVIMANTFYPNIDRAAQEECFASLSGTANQHARCTVSMKDFSFNKAQTQMDKVVTFDCRKKPGGDPSDEIKTISKKKGTIDIKCQDKNALTQIIEISLDNGKSVNIEEYAWKCQEENLSAITNGNGGHCQIKRPGYLNESKMTVKYKCSNPPRRDVNEFIQEKGKGKQGKKTT